MFIYLLGDDYFKWITLLGVIFAFALTFVSISLAKRVLPRDAGRAFAINGSKSVGKPRGAGLVFILTFTISTLFFVKVNTELCIYLVLIILEMLSGYFDDASSKPWGELKKGLIDLAISIVAAVTFLHFNPNTFNLALFDKTITLNPIVYGILIIVLIWASINVTNCSDGVDGLCASLSIITLTTTYVLFHEIASSEVQYRHIVMLMVVCLLAYLWFNASPSQLLMGDAGSRAIGIFIAITFLKLHSPFLFILMALMLIIDGGLGLVKLTIMRVFKTKNFMKNIRTPIHDHMRKNKEWSDTQVVIRFVIIQLIIGLAVIYALV
ncbi:MraY family glycosyltransferase [Lachnospira pectinoschiza]|uniref:Phospho-N-acetylmuramoyl-pentapeptide-transferase n=1 Tax=Lachnospira pectinoschiza TaxID=28052 RepID=A0A1G9YPK3_9FIRM|nr:phospho-N-acetylmuramoyl-pentapeptide-transferase [Lachnospira pectinoschiza]SDN11088.1 phospho-N-acetylmuramoyl-pentapeptide-transferase [Lachnospira pectinoschiza]